MIPEILVTVNSTESTYRSYPVLEYHLPVLEKMTTPKVLFYNNVLLWNPQSGNLKFDILTYLTKLMNLKFSLLEKDILQFTPFSLGSFPSSVTDEFEIFAFGEGYFTIYSL